MNSFQTEFDRYYAKAVETLQQAGSDAAYRHIQTIDDSDYRDSTFAKLSCLLADQNKMDDALRFCSSIKGPRERVYAFIDMGKALINKGLLHQAKQVLSGNIGMESIDCAYDRAAVLLSIAEIYWQAGSQDEGLQFVHQAADLAKPSPQDFEASKTIRACARLLAKWRHVSEAIQVAQFIDSRWSELREETLEEVQGRGRWPVSDVNSL